MVVAAPILVIQASPALACSCGPLQVKDALSISDGAFVGVFLGREDVVIQGAVLSSAQPVINHFRVERTVKGDIRDRVEVQAPLGASSCGLELDVGERVGLLLRGGVNEWRSSLCSETDPNALLEFASDTSEASARTPPRRPVSPTSSLAPPAAAPADAPRASSSGASRTRLFVLAGGMLVAFPCSWQVVAL